MTATLRIASLLALMACDHSRDEVSPLTGTYRLQICRVSCAAASGGEVMEEGRLILLATPLNSAALSRDAQFVLALDGDPTACWIGDPPAPSQGTGRHASVGGSVWQRDTVSGILRVKLWVTVDSHYEVTAESRGDSLVGWGLLYAANEGGEQLPRDVVIARRIGPPESAPCAPAAEALVASWRARVDTMAVPPT